MEHYFESREAASVAASTQIASALHRRLEAHASATLVVSGGTTPVRCFADLSTRELDWQRVHVLASDDRWVPADHEDSNEKLIRDHLLVEKAAAAGFTPYYAPHESIESRCKALSTALRGTPFACSLLGMGTDGHFASLFPDAENLAAGLDLDSNSLCLPVKTQASPHLRVSLSLAALASSDEIVLLIFGEDKRSVLEAAQGGNENFPVSHLLAQTRTPVHTYWAP